MSRDNLVLPERVEGESAGKYYSRVEEVIPKRAIALLLSKSADAFNVDVLRSLLRTFKFYEEPLDISLRKFLWEMDISGEAQQIERIIDAFAERYQECNPHIFDDFEQVSFISFSLVILHSDLYNKNNKHKMQRHEYQKNSGGHGIEDEILGYLYDNIQYTEFIQQEVNEEDSEGKGRPKLRRFRSRAHTGTSDSRSDPYEFIIDPELKLDVLRPSLKNVLNLDDTYNYLGPHGRIDIAKIREAFARPGILHLISARSRPEAYASASTTSNPLEASQGQGVVEISVVKIGIIWRKDPKKRKTQRPWQPWIALLTQSQLYIFRNSGWIRNLLEKWEAHQKHPERRLVMTPYIEDFKPDLSVRTVNAVALFDSSYDRHKNAFVLSRRDDSFEEIFLADNESDLHDWLGKINCASTFTTANISLLPIQQSISMSQRRQSQDPFYDLGLTLNSESASILNDARAAAMSTRRSAIEEELVHAKEKLEDQLRNARHLQILAPFPSKSRSELLAFGARISHRIRWARYEMWRLQCYKDVIVLVASFEALGQLDNNTAVPAIRDSPRVSTKAFGLSRLNSKGSMFSNSPKTAKTTKDSPRVSVQSSLGKTNSEHLTTEPTAQRPISTAGSTSTSAASQLPSLRLESASLNWERRLSGRLSDRPMSSGGESLARKVSTISTASGLERSDIDSTKELPATPTHGPSVDDESKDEVTAMRFSVNDVDRPRDQSASRRDQHPFGSPDSGRTSARRSLRETLRDAKELPGIHHHRGRMVLGSTSGSHDDVHTPKADKSAITRGEGSFRVHGKKASVITLPSEFMHMSPEDRLRPRRPVQEDDARSFAPSLLDGEQTASRSSMSDFDSSATFGTAGTSFYRDTSVDSHGSAKHLKRPDGPLPRADFDTNVDALPLDLAVSKVAPTTAAGKRLYDAINRESDKENGSLFDDSSTTATPRAKRASRLITSDHGGLDCVDGTGTFLESASASDVSREE